jgi:hypothetical protein
MTSSVAKTRFWVHRTDGSCTAVNITIYQPTQHFDHASCQILIQGLDDRARTIYGEDTFQALSLALRLVRSTFEMEEERGSVISLTNEKAVFDWRCSFP